MRVSCSGRGGRACRGDAAAVAVAATMALTAEVACLRQSRRAYHSISVTSSSLWRLPYYAKSMGTTKEELDRLRYFTDRPRDKWDYKRVDDNINSQSVFRNTAGREQFFEGARADNSTTNAGSTHTPHKYRLYEHFDEYTKPGVNTKWAAVEAVKEQWDADEFYYPGEAWRRNRPSFRSVPKEMLNRETWYHPLDLITKAHEIFPMAQPRAWHPSWPPPGYRMPTFSTTHEYAFGGDDAGLTSEFERHTWYRSWIENNYRFGWFECLMMSLVVGCAYYIGRTLRSVTAMRDMCAGLYYPGKTILRPFGVPRDWEKDVFWWQRPLNEFPQPSVVWYMHALQYKYIDYIKQRDCREQALAAAETASAMAA